MFSFWMLGVLELEESFDSRITDTLTLCRSKNSHISVSLLPIPFALNCMMVNDLYRKLVLELMVVALVVLIEWVRNCTS